jgi:elongation factor G
MWPLIEIPLQTRAGRDQDRLSLALGELSAQDRSLRVRIDRDTGQLLLGGQSEEQLERALSVLTRNERLTIDIGRPRVAYRETITKPVEYTHTHKRISGNAGQYAEVSILFEPLERGQGFAFVDRTVTGAVPRDYIRAVEQGLMFQKEDGIRVGYPTVDFRATLVGGKYHDVDSNALTFEIAARACFREALRLAGPIILEPVMKLEIVTPEDCLSAVIADIGRRCQIEDERAHGSAITVAVTVPLAEMIGYAKTLSGISQGRASFSMDFYSYEPVPGLDLPPDNFPPAVGLRA